MPFHETREPHALSRHPAGRPTQRVRGTVLAACILGAALLAPAVASAGTAKIVFTDPGEHAFRLPAGLIGSLHLDAIGAAGQEPGPSANGQTYGGIGAEVSGNLAIGAGTVYAEVGVGGGHAYGDTPAGGGASDVRRCRAEALF